VSESGTHYRLSGDVGGVVRSYGVPAGESSIGSVAGNQIVLGVRGVSRRHALITLGTDGLLVEDLGSKNGTRVNGVRVQRSRLQSGDQVLLGPVILQVEEVSPDDDVLAIRVCGADTPSGLPAQETTAVSTVDEGAPGIEIVERVLLRLAVRPEPDFGGALDLLKRELGARGAALFELTRGEPVVLAGSGELPDLGGHRGFQDLAKSAPGATPPVTASSYSGDPPLLCAIQAGPTTDRLGLALSGPLEKRREGAERLVRVLLELADLYRPRPLLAASPDPSGRTTGPRGLVFPPGYVPGDAPAMASLYAQMQSLVQGDLPVLLLGETGVGKEFLARILHSSSRRRGGPFVAVNCAAIPEDLLEAEMFGIVKGAATGVSERLGRFQQAEGGTLFLDEIGDMPLPLQAKLLRALQEKEVQPVGASAPVSVDIRVVAATNSDLQRRMDDGRFRRDLYYRVAGYAVQIPPLRDRREDIPSLVEEFIRIFARETAKSVRGITVKALRSLSEYSWPGNIRELEHEVRRLIYQCPEGQAIESRMLSEHVVAPVRGGSDDRGGGTGEGRGGTVTLELLPNVELLERRLIKEALARAGGNRTQAARLLGVSRNGLAIKMERLGIEG
jgi:transcriptional regulator with AAA-type ATPase domain